MLINYGYGTATVTSSTFAISTSRLRAAPCNCNGCSLQRRLRTCAPARSTPLTSRHSHTHSWVLGTYLLLVGMDHYATVSKSRARDTSAVDVSVCVSRAVPGLDEWVCVSRQSERSVRRMQRVETSRPARHD